jgi:hypothetical protein
VAFLGKVRRFIKALEDDLVFRVAFGIALWSGALLSVRLPPRSNPRTTQFKGGSKVIKILGKALLVGWALFILFIAACFLLPKAIPHFSSQIAPFIVLVPIVLLIGTAVYVAARIFSAGFKRATH